jgi:hypothetical protein
MGKWIKDNLVLVSGIVLPILLIGGFLVLSSMPRMLADPPQYDFILVNYHYDYQQPGNYTLSFEVRDERLTGKAIPKDETVTHANRQHASLFRYDAEQNAFEEIPYDLPENVDSIETPTTLELRATSNLKLDKRNKSPDGYTFEYLGYRGRGGLLGELFGMRRSYESNYVLKKGSAHFDLPNPSNDPNYYANDLRFLGWIVDEGSEP